MKALLKAIVEFLLPKNQFQSEIDAYIASKNPTNSSEVEYWIRQYDMRSRALTQVYSR
jgi:hypothetical protein